MKKESVMEKKELTFGLVLFMLISVMCQAFGPPGFMKIYSLKIMTGQAIVGYFLLIGGFTTFILLLYFMIKSDTDYTAKIRSNKKRFYYSFGFLLISWPLLYGLYVYAMNLHSITETVVIVRLAPMLVVIFSIPILGEKIKSKLVLVASTIICIVGVYIASGNGFFSFNVNNLFNLYMLITMLTVVAMVVNNISYSYIKKEFDLILASFSIGLSMFLSGIVYIISCFVFHNCFIGLNTESFVLIAVLGIFTVSLPALIKLFVYDKTDSMTQVTFFNYLIPIAAIFIAYYWNHERIGNLKIVAFGLIVIIVGLIIANNNIDRSKDND